MSTPDLDTGLASKLNADTALLGVSSPTLRILQVLLAIRKDMQLPLSVGHQYLCGRDFQQSLDRIEDHNSKRCRRRYGSGLGGYVCHVRRCQHSGNYEYMPNWASAGRLNIRR